MSGPRTRWLGAEVVTPVFKERRKGAWKVISFSAKRARGLMSRFAVMERITTADDLKGFDLEGYRYRDGDSDESTWVFGREQPKR